MRKKYSRVMIVGAGAAGLFCGAILASAGIAATILEGGPKAGRKLDVSGGGFANFSNRNLSPCGYFSHGPDVFCQYGLSVFNLKKALRYIRHIYGFPVVEKERGRLFLDVPARNLTAALLRDCFQIGSQLHYNGRVYEINRANNIFNLRAERDDWQCEILILALGSPARPRLALCPDCWKLPVSLGHKIFPPRPALAPLLFPGNSYAELKNLSGLSLKVKINALENTRSYCQCEDDLLFTHTGLSGPAPFNVSLFWRSGSAVMIDFLPGHDVEKLLDAAEKSTPRSLLRRYLPPRLIDALLPTELARRYTGQLSRRQRKEIAACVKIRIFPDLTPGPLSQAEVCAGGVDLAEIDPRTMESRLVKNLYLIGEMQDITGKLGGYNLHWAFASAYCAARAIIGR